MSMQIPFMDLKRQYDSIQKEVDAAIFNVIHSTSFIGGAIKEQFEKEFAEALGVKHCIGVGNGTDSLFLILKAMKLPLNSEVLVPANSFIATSEAASLAGLKPRFVDIDPVTMNMNLQVVEEILESESHLGKIRAIIPVHLYGRMMNMPRLMKIAQKFGLKVIEDSAQAHLAEIDGKKSGTYGDAGSFSFYPGKNLGAYGDAGCVVTNDDELASLVRKIANHGRVKKYDHDMEGINSRLDTLQAAVLSVKLKHLPTWTAQRREKARIYDELFSSIPNILRPELPHDKSHVFHLYVIRIQNRDEVAQKLKAAGIDVIIHYPLILPSLKAYEHLGLNSAAEFPVAYGLQNEILSLPLFPEITQEEQTYVAKTLIQIISSMKS